MWVGGCVSQGGVAEGFASAWRQCEGQRVAVSPMRATAVLNLWLSCAYLGTIETHHALIANNVVDRMFVTKMGPTRISARSPSFALLSCAGGCGGETKIGRRFLPRLTPAEPENELIGIGLSETRGGRINAHM